jgi:hypothetical protein
MMTRLATRIALIIVAIAAAIGIAAAPANATGYVKQGSYGWGDQYLGVGYYGVQNHQWQSYYCETVQPSGATGPGLYYLWVLY